MEPKSRKLTAKTESVYRQVKEHEARTKSVAKELQRSQELVAGADREQLDQILNAEKASLNEVLFAQTKLQDTVGSLIAGYDALTNALGGEIDSMKEMTTWESVVGFFSATTARELRERRIQQADIDKQLQELVTQTQAIGALLAGHFETLGREYDTVLAMLDEQQLAHKHESEAFESAERELDALNLELGAARDKLAELTGAARADADRALQDTINRANRLTEQRNIALSNAQTHELFVENHKLALDSLMRQKAAQRIMIDKLRISTENRIVQYAATLESLKTAAQQEAAHTLDRIGTEVDEATVRTMASIGTAADRAIIDMLERHGPEMQRRRSQQLEVARADAEFARRFAEVAKQFLEENYPKP